MSNNTTHGNCSVIEQDVHLVGDLTFSQDLIVNGKITGNLLASLDSDAKVLIHESGIIEGEIRAPHVMVQGTTQGNIFATKRLSLANSAKIHGDVHYGSLEMEQGASINGMLVSMGQS